MEKTQPNFEDDDVGVFWYFFKLTGDTQLGRHFCNSMKKWNKQLINASQKGHEQE